MKLVARSYGVASAVVAAILAHSAVGAESSLPLSASSCTTLRNDRERLACYDRAMSYREDQETAATPALPESMFGANNQRTRPVAAAEIVSISARVKSLRNSADGALVIELDNGQVWLQTQGSELLLSANDPVTISRAAMSSFRISTPSQRTARVKRLQ